MNAHGGDEMGIVSALSSNVVLDNETFPRRENGRRFLEESEELFEPCQRLFCIGDR